jgi:transcription termination factor NusB
MELNSLEKNILEISLIPLINFQNLNIFVIINETIINR